MASPIESSSGNLYPSDPDVSKFVKDHLSGSNNYEQWRQQMLNLINSYGLYGFITGGKVNIPEDAAAAASSHIKEIERQNASNDFLLKCIRKTLTEDISQEVELFRTAKRLWTRLEEMFRKPIRSMASSCIYPYPSDLVVSEFVLHTLSRGNYSEWKEQMFDLIKKEGLVGFINGTAKAPPKRITAEDIGNGDSSPPNLIENELYGAWKRSDDLLRKWIRSTLAGDIRQEVRLCRTATGLWTKLEKLFDEKTVKQLRQYQPLQIAAIYGDWESANRFIDTRPDAVRKPINEDSETALIVAVKSKQTIHFVRNLLKKMSPVYLTLGDINGWTALHTAVVAGNIEAVKLLVEKNKDLPGVPDLDRQLPLFYAAKFHDKEMVHHLWPLTKGYPDEMGATLLCELVTSELYDFALKLLKDDPKLACMEPSALLAIAKKPSSFSSGTLLSLLNFLERVICWGIGEGSNQAHLNTNVPTTVISENIEIVKQNDFANQRMGVHQGVGDANEVHFNINMPQAVATEHSEIVSQNIGAKRERESSGGEQRRQEATNGGEQQQATTASNGNEQRRRSIDLLCFLPSPIVLQIKKIREKKLIHYQALEILKFLCEEIKNSGLSSRTRIFMPPLIQAIKEGTPQIVEQMLRTNHLVVFLSNENWQSIFQQAIVWRCEKVFDLGHQSQNYKSRLLSIVDASGNNALHLAGDLARPHILHRRAGAALQMQRELQWFKEIEKIVLPRSKEKNAEGKAPIEVFIDSHKDLVKDAERWMKDTANSCTIVATLIATVVFAAAITVPGGNNNDSGHPIFSKHYAFFIFAIFDALALFSSISSVLMFLSITTSRYAVDDFHFSLPNKLIIGLGTLFVSILSMMIAFGATLYIMFGDSFKTWIFFPIITLAFIPVILFVALQFPLFVNMIKSTYGPGIIGKKSDPDLQKSGEETESKSPVNTGSDASV